MRHRNADDRAGCAMTRSATASRRRFLGATGSAFAALLASGCVLRSPRAGEASDASYGPLLPDPAGVLDLPGGFSYRVLSRRGDAMDDGGKVPDAADGMGCFALPGNRIALVRNHELTATQDAGGNPAVAFDFLSEGNRPLPGGTTTLVLDARTLEVRRQFRSLAGTIRNCAGGVTPWGSWLTCEEDVTRAAVPLRGGQRVGQDHGWIFEVPAAAEGLVQPVPLKAMGRFYHEAAAVDARSGMVFLTEDRDDGLFYRFIPRTRQKLADGGRLQALAIDGLPDSRNRSAVAFEPASWKKVRWVDIENPESPADDLRKQGAQKGATLFARGEGVHMGAGQVYFCCTSGGAARLGQIFRLNPARDELQLFFESTSIGQFNYGDNLTVAPNGHLVVCEDQYTERVSNFLRGIAPSGQAYPLGRLHAQTELAGACFSPDGKVMFVNAYSPALTLAITGPWRG
jgi:secreted PhoX family phosphatase